MIGTIESPKTAGCGSCLLGLLFWVLFAVISYLWSLACPIYEYKQAGYEDGESICFEHGFFNKSSVAGRLELSAHTAEDQLFKGRWEGNRLFLTFQDGGDGGRPEEAVMADNTIFFRGKTFIGGRIDCNFPFISGM